MLPASNPLALPAFIGLSPSGKLAKHLCRGIAKIERLQRTREDWAMSETVLAGFLKALSSGAIRVVDLSQPLDAGTATIRLPPEFGKTWPFHLEEISKYDSRGPAWYWNNFSCGEHTGTHFDAPVHWVTGKDYPDNATDNIPVFPWPNSSRQLA